MATPASVPDDLSAESIGHRRWRYIARLLWVIVGVAGIGIGAGTLRSIGAGVDPYTAANIGISAALGLDLGTYQLLSNLVLFVPMLIWGRRYIGVGSIVNMVFAGFAVQFASDLIAAVLPAFVPTWLRLALFLAGILVFCLGASLYMTAALGTAPYDALAPMIVDGTRAPYRAVRVGQDVFFLVLALVFHGAVGFGTVVTAFFTGPLIEFFNGRVSTPLLRHDLEARTPRQRRTRTAPDHL